MKIISITLIGAVLPDVAKAIAVHGGCLKISFLVFYVYSFSQHFLCVILDMNNNLSLLSNITELGIAQKLPNLVL